MSGVSPSSGTGAGSGAGAGAGAGSGSTQRKAVKTRREASDDEAAQRAHAEA